MKSLRNLLSRRMARFVEKAVLPPPHQSIVTFSFDDCPRSAIQTALPMLEAEDWRATIYVACGLCDTTNHLGLHMSLEDVVAVHSSGHEIADHTYSHLNTMDVSLKTFLADIKKNQKTLKNLGLPPSRHFAYPFGEVSPALKQALRTRFATLRGVISPNNPSQDANLLNAMRLYSDDTIEAAIAQISQLTETPQWLHLFTHDVRDMPSQYGCTRENFARVVSAVKASGALVLTVDQAFQKLQQRETIS